MTMAGVNQLVKSTGDGSSQRFNAASLGKNMDAFDDFLCDIIPEPSTNSTPARKNPINTAIKVVDSDEESLFSSDSEDEFGSEKAKPQYYQTDGALEQLFSKAPKSPAGKPPQPGEGAPRSTKQLDDMSKNTSDHSASRQRSAKEELSTSNHGRRRSAKDDLSSSSHGRRRSAKDDLSSSSHGKRRSTNEELSVSSHGRGRSSKDDLSTSSHGGRRRSSRTEEANNRKSVPPVSPLPPATRKSSNGTKDELSRSEHAKPRLRRNDLYSKAHHIGKGDGTRVSKQRSSVDYELAAESAKKLQERRAHYERARRENTGRQSAPGSMMRRVESSPNDLSQSCHGPRRRSRMSLSDLSGSEHPSRLSSREPSARGRKSEGSGRDRRSSSRGASVSRSSRRERHGSGDLKRSGSSANTQGMEGMYAASRGQGLSGMRRCQSSADAHSLSRKSRPSGRGPAADIDMLVTKLRRESKITTISKNNATWNLNVEDDSDIED